MRLLLVAFVRACKLLPEGLAIRLGAAFGFLAGRVFRFRRRIVAGQLAVALPDADHADLIRRFYRHVGLLTIELLRLPFADDAELNSRLVWHGREHLEALQQSGEGFLMMSAHLGNWELTAQSMRLAGVRINAVGKAMKTGPGDLLRRLIRDENGVPTIPKSGSGRQLLRLLKRGEGVGFLIDQNMLREEAVFVDFLGQPASTMKGLAWLALRTGAPILPGYSWRDPDDRRHHVELFPPLRATTVSDDPEENLRHNTARFNALIETMVRAHPEQWLWLHKRWKTRPLDESAHPFPY